MQSAPKRLFSLLLLVIAAVFVAAPATALAKHHPKPARYVVVSRSAGCHVTVNPRTGKLHFHAAPGFYGRFRVVVRHGKHRRVYYFTVNRPPSVQVPVPTLGGVPSPPEPPVVPAPPVVPPSPPTPRLPTPYPVRVSATGPPPDSVRVATGGTPTSTCQNIVSAINGAPGICNFTVPLSQGFTHTVPPGDVARQIEEARRVCVDFADVLNYQSAIAVQHPEQLQTQGQYYFDTAPDSSGHPALNCFALLGGNLGGNQWMFAFNESNLPWPPTTIKDFIASIPASEYPYAFPYTIEP